MQADLAFREVTICGRWTIRLPEHKASLPCWQHWEYERLRAMYAAIRPDDYILDIGAEQGDLSALFASWLGEQGAISLIEPTAEVWPTIHSIFEANNLRPPAWSFSGFVADEERARPEPGKLLILPHWPIEVKGPTVEEPGFRFIDERPDIESITLDRFVGRTGFQPTVITIDVEGAEYLVLKGGAGTLLRDRPIVFCSVHPEMMRESFGHNPDDLHVLMTHHYGYKAEYLGYDHEAHWMYKP